MKMILRNIEDVSKMLDKNLSKKIKDVIKDVPYQKLILFGSYSRGTNTQNSDIDLLLVTRKNILIRQKMDLATRLRKQFAEKRMDVDVIIKNEQEIRDLQDKQGSIVYQAMREGIVL